MVNNNKITMGQGEYVVFHELPNGEKREVTRETYEKAYSVLLEFAPAAIVNNEKDKKIAELKCEQRYELMREKIKQIDPTLEIAFIPSTLYELFFIRKCIKEDLKQKDICNLLNPMYHRLTDDSEINKLTLKIKEDKICSGKCWHCCYFEDAGNNEDKGVKYLAYRLNATIVKNLLPTHEGYSQEELSKFTEDKIEFLKNHYKNGSEELRKINNGEQVVPIASTSYPGPTTNFGYDSGVGSIKFMGITNEEDAEIIKKAVKLECSNDAQNSFILYRGSDFKRDSVSTSDNNTPYSLSFGTSLFAGCMFDGGATAFHYMRKEKNAYAVYVPYGQLNNSPFYIPSTNRICQLFGHGESFHGRTKGWKFRLINKIAGINIGGGTNPRPLLVSSLSKTQLISQFKEYKMKATQLK